MTALKHSCGPRAPKVYQSCELKVALSKERSRELFGFLEHHLITEFQTLLFHQLKMDDVSSQHPSK